jgi:hypothetical protein
MWENLVSCLNQQLSANFVKQFVYLTDRISFEKWFWTKDDILVRTVQKEWNINSQGVNFHCEVTPKHNYVQFSYNHELKA